MVARIVLAVAALLVGAWLVHSLHDAQLADDAARVAPGPPAPRPSPQAFGRARDLLRRAEGFNPDLRPDVSEAGLLLYEGHTREAIALFRKVIDQEPANTTALFSLGVALRQVDPAGAAAVQQRLRQLAPPPPGS